MKIWLLFLLLLTACSQIPQEDGILEVYFCPSANCTQVIVYGIGPDTVCALYDLSPAVNSIMKDEGVGIVVDSDNYRGYGTSIEGYGLMHDKFCVTGDTVVTGSFNPTRRGESFNDNNLLRLVSPSIAENYRNEFINIRDGKDRKTPNRKVVLDGVLVENYFCPRDQCQKKVLETLRKANESIQFMVFSFTDDDIGELLSEKARIIPVEGVFESGQDSEYSEYSRLAASPANVSYDSNPYNMHHKVFIIDSRIVITGSYNPTANGNRNNRENILIIHDRMVATAFIKEFQRIRDASKIL